MEEKVFTNATECVKVAHRMLLLQLSLQSFLMIVLANYKSAIVMSSAKEQVNVPMLNFQMNPTAAVAFALVLVFGCSYASCTALVRLNATVRKLTPEYAELFELYPTFLTSDRWARIIAGLLWAVFAIVTLIGLMNVLSFNFFGDTVITFSMIPSLALSLLIPLWDKG